MIHFELLNKQQKEELQERGKIFDKLQAEQQKASIDRNIDQTRAPDFWISRI